MENLSFNPINATTFQVVCDKPVSFSEVEVSDHEGLFCFSPLESIMTIFCYGI